ncbi:MAG: acyl-CoA thioesterase [Planctomycetaceae bacterium]|nr:MAG: acyl-CoA thioesterase [Planctomycetaceae bacterium]
MNWFIYHIASGHAFFTGIGVIMIAVWAGSRSSGGGKRVATWSLLLGALAVAISSTPLPGWVYVLATVVTVFWIVSLLIGKRLRWTAWAVVGVWAFAAAIELPYHFLPGISVASSRSIAVIGDSISAGMGDSDRSVKWPELLEAEHGLRVHDLSFPGATAASAWKLAGTQRISCPIVILQIGGNDLLGGNSPTQFAQDLDLLLASVRAPGRQLVMFELPLPPGMHQYGRIQRKLARKHDVRLIPKRVLMGILAAKHSTVDTIHLTPLGHQRMATYVWQIIRPAFPPVPTAGFETEPEANG